MNDRNYYKLQSKLYDFLFDKMEMTIIEYDDDDLVLYKNVKILDLNSYVTEWGGEEIGVTEVIIKKRYKG